MTQQSSSHDSSRPVKPRPATLENEIRTAPGERLHADSSPENAASTVESEQNTYDLSVISIDRTGSKGPTAGESVNPEQSAPQSEPEAFADGMSAQAKVVNEVEASGSAKATTEQNTTGITDVGGNTPGEVAAPALARREWMLPPDVNEYQEAFEAIRRAEPPNPRMAKALMERGYLTVIPEDQRASKQEQLVRQKSTFADLDELLERRSDLYAEQRSLNSEVDSLEASLRYLEARAAKRFSRLRSWMKNERFRSFATGAVGRFLRGVTKYSPTRLFRKGDKRETLRADIALKESHYEGVKGEIKQIGEPIQKRQAAKRLYEKGLAELESQVQTEFGHVVLNVLGEEAARVVDRRVTQIAQAARTVSDLQLLVNLYEEKIRETTKGQVTKPNWFGAEKEAPPTMASAIWRSELLEHQKKHRRNLYDLRRDLTQLKKIEAGFLPEPIPEQPKAQAGNQPELPDSQRRASPVTSRWQRIYAPPAQPRLVKPVEKLEDAPVLPEARLSEGLPTGSVPYFAPPAGKKAYELIQAGHLASGNQLLLANAENLEPDSYLRLVERVTSRYCELGDCTKAIEVLNGHQGALTVDKTRRIAAVLIIKAADSEKMDQVAQLAGAFTPTDRQIARAIHDLAVLRARSDGLQVALRFATKTAQSTCPSFTTRIVNAVQDSFTKAQRPARRQPLPDASRITPQESTSENTRLPRKS